MASNYPDGVSESTPDAPWNRPDAPLRCSACYHKTFECEVGDECESCLVGTYYDPEDGPPEPDTRTEHDV